eukprot:TRINITY_DN75988_c0_g1_i1.p1 TRINITY_DN75988_c0_g1~~TRINITY_DN75988_c0_g1_i1.p1  ORF type:complete len:666 (+),score=96.78 TRINITY_DN75988_c0_g1_i1:214-1998(+)
MASSGRTGAGICSSSGHVVGLITENDLMRAYFEGMPPDKHLSDWLDSGISRAPPEVVSKISVSRSDRLAQVADKMVNNATAGDCACHHIIVQDEQGHLEGVVSSLDMVQAWCRVSHKKPMPAAPSQNDSKTVGDAMKPRENVFTCPPISTMNEVLKLLLLVHQNGVLIADDGGVYGIITPRDAVKAFVDGESLGTGIVEWLRKVGAAASDRYIASTASLPDAAELMTARKVHHLVVVPPGSSNAIGLLSSLDLVLAAQASSVLPCSPPAWDGPTVSEQLDKTQETLSLGHSSLTLHEAANLLLSSGRTAVAVALASIRLLTEWDIMRSYAESWPGNTTVEQWIQAQEFPRPTIPQHLMIPRSMSLTEAATLMVNASDVGGEPCHHLVVKGVHGEADGWLGIFSALDVARGLCSSITSKLDAAQAGADQTRVFMVMKPLARVPKFLPDASLVQVFSSMIVSRQGASLVMDHDGNHLGVITPRCAVEAMVSGISPDLTIAAWLEWGGRTVSKDDAQNREVTSGTRLLDAASTMAENAVHHLIVVQEKGPATTGMTRQRVLGIVSALDLARGVASMHCRCPFVSLGWIQLLRSGSAQ